MGWAISRPVCESVQPVEGAAVTGLTVRPISPELLLVVHLSQAQVLPGWALPRVDVPVVPEAPRVIPLSTPVRLAGHLLYAECNHEQHHRVARAQQRFSMHLVP